MPCGRRSRGYPKLALIRLHIPDLAMRQGWAMAKVRVFATPIEVTNPIALRAKRAAARRSVSNGSYLVDPASSHMLVSKIKPCMSKYKQLYGETANGSLNQL
jgi:hypothetical protein